MMRIEGDVRPHYRAGKREAGEVVRLLGVRSIRFAWLSRDRMFVDSGLNIFVQRGFFGFGDYRLLGPSPGELKAESVLERR
jgi:hypothetical protein